MRVSEFVLMNTRTKYFPKNDVLQIKLRGIVFGSFFFSL